MAPQQIISARVLLPRDTLPAIHTALSGAIEACIRGTLADYLPASFTDAMIAVHAVVQPAAPSDPLSAITTIAAARALLARIPTPYEVIADGWRRSKEPDACAYLLHDVIPQAAPQPVREYAAALLAVAVIPIAKGAR